MQIPEKAKVKMTGILSYTAITTGDIEINRYIGLFFVSFLQDSCQNMFDAEVTREMIEGIMDIYSDNAFFYDNPVFVAHGFLKSLEAIKSQLRSKFKQNHQLETKVKEYCIETLNTFSEFLEFKRKEQTQVI